MGCKVLDRKLKVKCIVHNFFEFVFTSKGKLGARVAIKVPFAQDLVSFIRIY